MTVYYVTYALVFVFAGFASFFSMREKCDGLLYREQPASTKVFLFLTASVMIFVAGFRYYVGADYGGYYKNYDYYAEDCWHSIITFDEPGIRIIAWVLRLFTNDAKWFIFVCSLLTIALYLITIYQSDTSSFIFASLLFLTGPWDGTFNGVRQYFAAAVLIFGHRYILNRQFWKYLLTVFIATCFHVTAVIMLPLYFLLRNRITPRNIILLALGTMLLSWNYDTIFEFIGLLKDIDATNATEYANTSVNILRVLAACAPAVFCIILHLRQQPDEEEIFYLNALTIHAAAMVVTRDSAYLARITLYTGGLISIALPKLVKLKNYRAERLVKACIIILYTVFWWYETQKSSALNNFKFVFFK